MQATSGQANHEFHILNFTPTITSKDVYGHFVSSLVKKKPRCFGTKSNKSFVMFIDNFELPLTDSYGDQAPCEYIQLYLDHNKLFDFEDYKDVDLIDTNIVCGANYKPGLNQKISNLWIENLWNKTSKFGTVTWK